MDARDYKDISTIELERPIFDLEVDATSSLLSVVEGRYPESSEFPQEDAICRLYDIGRKRPSEDDSDAEDAMDESDTLDDDEYDNESESDDEEEDDEDSEDDEGEEFDTNTDYDSSNDGSPGSDEEDGDEDDDMNGYEGDEDGDDVEEGSLMDGDVGYILELPEGAYYNMRSAQYSSDEEDEEDDD